MKLNGKVEIETKIRRNDGSETVEHEEYEVVDGVIQDGNTGR